VAQHPFPGPGHDGDQPTPGIPARDGAGDAGERYLDWLTGEIAAGREETPPEEEPPPAVMVRLGEATDAGLAGSPGPVLGALTAQAVEDVASLPDGELFGVISAACRQQTRAEYEELAAVAEFSRRRAKAYEVSKARGDKPRHREGEFPAEELGMELTCSYYTAGKRMELADDLSRRLRCTFAGMANGTIDGYKAKIIHEFTRFLSDEQAAQADQILAAAAPEMAPAVLKQKAARLEMKLDPDGVRQRKEEAARKHRRVEARQEASGNAALAGRELAVEDALTAKNSVWAEAAALCNAGLGVSLREARTMVYLDRLRGLNPRDRLNPPYDPDDGDLGDDGPGDALGGDDPGDEDPDVPADADDGHKARPADASREHPAGDRDDDDASFPDDSDPSDDRDDAPRDGDGTGRFPDDGYGENENGDEDEDEDEDEDGGADGGDGQQRAVRHTRPARQPGRPGAAARADQHHRLRRNPPRLVRRPRRSQRLRPARPRRRPRPHRRCWAPPPL
jgi:uncharacterized protein DUF222